MDKSSSINLDIYLGQVSGKQPKLLSEDHTKLLKGFNKEQNQFYKLIISYDISHPYAAIQAHIPAYHGLYQLSCQPQINITGQNQKNTIIWLNHLASRYKIRNEGNKFIVLSNLTYAWELPNIFDIKIGGRNVEGKKHKITKSVSNFMIKLNGLKINFTKGGAQSVFLSKYFLKDAVQMQNILQYFGLFFFDGERVLLQTVKSLAEKLKDLILAFKSLKSFQFISSSLCILFDAKNPQKCDIKFLDFGRVSYMNPGFTDHQTMTGMENILKILLTLIEIGKSNADKLKQLRKHFCETTISVIPQKKYEKYGDKGEKNDKKKDDSD